MSFAKLVRGLAGAALAALVGCDPRVTTIAQYDAGLGRYIEAETGELSGPFAIGDDASASSGHFIYAHEGATFDTTPGSARAAYELTADSAGTYQIWGRIHGQDVRSNRLWLQVDGGKWVLWRITTGDVWFWSYLHDNVNYGTPYTVALSAGTHHLLIANAADDTGLDRLYYTPDASKPEGNTTQCNPPHSVQLNDVCHPSCGALGGHCDGAECDASAPFVTYDCTGCCGAAP